MSLALESWIDEERACTPSRQSLDMSQDGQSTGEARLPVQEKAAHSSWFRTSQSRRMSFAESLVNVAVGFLVALACNALMLPAFDMHPKREALLWITVIMTAVSIARSYTLRRLFEWVHARVRHA